MRENSAAITKTKYRAETRCISILQTQRDDTTIMQTIKVSFTICETFVSIGRYWNGRLEVNIDWMW